MAAFKRQQFALLMSLAALGAISTDLYLPSLPSIGTAFRASQAEVQATLSIFMVGFAFSVLICGPLSDAFGRRPALLSALALFSFGSFLCALSPSIEMLWLARLLQSLAAGVGPVVTRAIIRDTHSQEESARMISYLSAGLAIAPLVGPFLGGVLETYLGWRANFLFLGFYGIVSWILVWKMLGETNAYRNQAAKDIGAMLRVYRTLIKERRYLGFVLCSASCYSGMFSFISGSAFVFITVRGVPPRFFGFCFGIFVLGFMSGASLSAKLGRRFGSEKILFWGGMLALFAGMTLSLAAFFDAPLLFLILPLYPYMLGLGMVTPSVQALAIGPHPEVAGAAGGLLNFITLASASLVGAILGHIPIQNALPMNIFMMLSAFFILVAFTALVRKNPA